ncbi:baseplate hub protein [Enterobacter hormaechei]|uniref:baseplate hub protein n=1 Tax=Enterobacter hormaechei TaxID=158836 RepID=UPI00335E0A58
MAFTEKKITAIFTLQDQTFADGTNQLTLSGIRMMANIESFGIFEQGTCSLRIWGMKPEDMNTLATMAIRTGISHNALTLLAGDDEKGMTQVFAGTIFDAYTDYNSLPDVAFCIDSSPGWFEKMVPAAANSFQGVTDVATMMKSLAAAAGFAFVNHGVTVQLSNHYLCGTVMAQIQDVATATGIGCRLANDTVEIWPDGEFTDEESIILSPETGLVGYPEFDPYGLAVTSSFNPDLVYGRRVTITSSIPQACGDFGISQCVHSISSKVPGGPWFTSLRVWNNDVPRTF